MSNVSVVKTTVRMNLYSTVCGPTALFYLKYFISDADNTKYISKRINLVVGPRLLQLLNDQNMAIQS